MANSLLGRVARQVSSPSIQPLPSAYTNRRVAEKQPNMWWSGRAETVTDFLLYRGLRRSPKRYVDNEADS